tara:strand:- start:170 stop:517 length:348 start_codon:yes stop_codon:yes gene_type:complete
MTEKLLNCLYCNAEKLVSKSFKAYVCDECYHKNQVKKSLYLLRTQIDAVLKDMTTDVDKTLWICKLCNKSTYETEYDYLAARNMHLECALKFEMRDEERMAHDIDTDEVKVVRGK